MKTLKHSRLIDIRLGAEKEKEAQRIQRIKKSREIAAQMLQNGMDVNSICRYTGLTEAQIP